MRGKSASFVVASTVALKTVWSHTKPRRNTHGKVESVLTADR